MNYFETYAPVVTWFAIRLMIIFGIIFCWALRQVDFIMAYPQAPIEMDIYMELPQGIQCWGLYIYLRLDTEMCVCVGHGFPCRELDRYVSTYEKWIQVEAVSSNQIFVWAMIFPCFYTP
jgi:hypothetical protein